ncbi:MAG TPA: peptidylprolyl isomerase [Candidatus Angelobacter sp.]
MSGFILTALLAMVMAPMQAPSTTQTAPTSASSPTAAHTDASPVSSTAPHAELAPTDPVITIHGLCSGAAPAKAKDASCTTVVSRQQFDGVMNGLNALGAPLLPAQRRAVAEGYATTLLNYEAAKKAGIDRDPRFAEVMRLARMRAMGDMYKAMEQEKATKVSSQEIETYYKNNLDNLEELTLRRVTLPRYNHANLKDEDYAAKARKVANDIQDRMAKGEDLDKLQKEAFDTLGVKDPPTTKMGPIRRGAYAADQEKQLFALKPGDVTAVVEQPSAFIIFKLERRDMPILEQAKDEIVRRLIKQHIEKQEEARSKSIHVEFNEPYLGSEHASDWMPMNALNTGSGHGSDPKTAHKDKQQK